MSRCQSLAPERKGRLPLRILQCDMTSPPACIRTFPGLNNRVLTTSFTARTARKMYPESRTSIPPNWKVPTGSQTVLRGPTGGPSKVGDLCTPTFLLGRWLQTKQPTVTQSQASSFSRISARGHKDPTRGECSQEISARTWLLWTHQGKMSHISGEPVNQRRSLCTLYDCVIAMPCSSNAFTITRNGNHN